MSSKNVLLRSKAVRLTVARLDSMRLAGGVGPLLVTSVRGGDHPSAWSVLLIAFIFAAMVGRALIRKTHLLLVLDEPTAALGPVAEHELLERYAGHSRRIARLTGTITVLVSPRCSTVRMNYPIVALRENHRRICGTWPAQLPFAVLRK